MRAELQAIVATLLAASVDTREVTLDELGEAIGTRAITPPEIDEMITALESAQHRVIGPQGGDGEKLLKNVVAAARALRDELGRKATVQEVAARAGMDVDAVSHALALLKVMQR